MVLYCYIDANYAVLWEDEKPLDPICYINMILFVVTVLNFQLLWVSNIQKNILIYTMHSEYVSLSQYIRYLLTLKIVINEVSDNLGMDSNDMKFASGSTVYEGGNGAIFVATSTRMTSNSYHIHYKYCCFWQHGGK